MTRVLFRPTAAAELDEAYRWYERERAGLGDEFLQAASSLLELIGNNPLAFPLVHRDRRRAVLRRFPYSVIYRIIGSDVFVLACFHGKRKSKGVAHSQMRADKGASQLSAGVRPT